MFLTFLLILVPLVVIYIFWIRPILLMRPGFVELYQREGALLAALKLRFSGLKQKLTTAIVFTAGTVVTLHDQIAPLVSSVDVTQIAAAIPAWAWPLITIAITLLVQYFRNLSDK